MKNTSITLSEETATKLNMMKYSLGFKTIEEVIQSLIKISEHIKNGN